jgi:solute carrier family 25 oxoglutarate transporter 11
MYKVGKQEEQNKPLAIVNAVDQSEQAKKNQMKSLSSGGQFFYGGLSGMLAICVVHPMDVVKTRMQLSNMNQHKNSIQAFLNIAKAEGFRSLYSGLTAGLFRQATYTTTKLGVFNVLMCELTKKDANDKPVPPSFMVKTMGGMVAGAFAAIVGTPAEVALIRMQSDGRLPVEMRRNYKHVFDALIRIYREEGLLRMWRGCSPTVGRAVVLNAAQLAVYAQAKQVILAETSLPDNALTHLLASLAAGFAASFVSLPFDMAKTTLQADGTQYKSTMDVLVKTVQRDGVFRLWRGFTPYFLKIGPHTVLTFLIFEQFRKAFGRLES